MEELLSQLKTALETHTAISVDIGDGSSGDVSFELEGVHYDVSITETE